MTITRVNPYCAVLDCDGVILDFDLCFHAVANDVLGFRVEKVSNSYDLSARYGLTKDQRARVWDALDDHPLGWGGMSPFPGAIEAAKKLKAQGLEIHVVTGIEPCHAQRRIANLLAHDLAIDGIECVGHGKVSKSVHIQRLAPIMYVEDRLHLLKEVDFVPHRAWVDLKDEQDDPHLTSPIVQVNSLAHWVDEWTQYHSPTVSNKRKFQP